MVLGNINKYKLADYITELEDEQGIVDVNNINVAKGDEDSCSTFLNGSAPSYTSRSRANLKVQEGCDYFCSYCIIPFLRGKPRSRDFASCIKEARELQKKYKEIVLTGINIGTYNYHGKDLADLIKELLEETKLERIRISSIEPDLVSDQLIELMQQEKRVCRHLHIPLQHGSNRILEKMNRQYSIEDYSTLVNRLEKEIPGVCIGMDVMTGFPGETEKDFQTMLDNLKNFPVSHFHVFRYSPKKGTRAYKMKNKVPAGIVKQRAKQVRELGQHKKHLFVSNYKDKIVEVLAEQKNKEGLLAGYTDNFIRVKFEGSAASINEIVKVKIRSVDGMILLGEEIGQ